MARKKDTLLFDTPPVVAAWAAAGGKKESEGPLASDFDFLTQDAGFCEQGCENWEQAESLLQRRAAELCLRKADLPRTGVDIAFAGDLQAQCTASNYTMRELGIPFAGVYGACSTMAETLALAAVFAAGGMAERALALTSSHFCAAERQFRTPLEYGVKRTPTAQWTATAAGACLVRAHGTGVPVRSVTFGRVQDYAVHDINNMGAAMMPAAASTLLRYFAATGARPQDFDAIFTGDLGEVGSALLREQMAREGLPLDNHRDCGCLLYDTQGQDVQAGGSGAGCSAAVLCCKILPMLAAGQLQFWSLLFPASAAATPKIRLAAMPPEAAVSPPVKAPGRPHSSTACCAPCASRCPKPSSGTLAPAPANSASGLYRPTALRITPATTYPVRMRAGVSFV